MFNLDLQIISPLLSFNPNDPLMFGSGLFLFLFFFLLVFYRLFANSKNARILLLIIFSLYFYYKASGLFFLLLIINAAANFQFGRLMGEAAEQSKKRMILILSLIFNLGILGYFKYTNFFIELASNVQNGSFDPVDIILPIGISFYTFKSLSYVIDIYLEIMKPTNSFRDFSLFVFFFPNILAGPIDRASKFLPQLQQDYNITRRDIAMGLMLIMMGLVKKIMIADYISLNFVDRVFEVPLRFTGVENLLAVYGYTLQLYADFSGYSDIAIGIALLLGFRLMENFNYPFKAKSIADFWRRWHISLSSWLLDYVFRPLQINFRNWRTTGNVAALIITFLLIGVWHGASWAFVIWGLLHGIYMAVGLITRNSKKNIFDKFKLTDTKLLGFAQIFVTFNLVAFSFLFFRADSFETASSILNQIYFFFKPEVFTQFIAGYTPTFILIAFGFLFHFLPSSLLDKTVNVLEGMPLVVQALLLAVVIWSVVQVQYADLQPFIYFQF
ncbi:Probable poly(beta-D-mannuronate) O-acetylase [hydrothermal vent metagenome]|uniref:Probable poly(Beta-D-mannuronate) O-acetylase n=1 Tax=hydrothermal vent metagenome TaxID=652676 RepID=A0A3B1CIA4_9ZZZZ